VPKVALLFLTKDSMPHERTWRLWLEGASGLLPNQFLPAAQVRAGLCIWGARYLSGVWEVWHVWIGLGMASQGRGNCGKQPEHGRGDGEQAEQHCRREGGR